MSRESPKNLESPPVVQLAPAGWFAFANITSTLVLVFLVHLGVSRICQLWWVHVLLTPLSVLASFLLIHTQLSLFTNAVVQRVYAATSGRSYTPKSDPDIRMQELLGQGSRGFEAEHQQFRERIRLAGRSDAMARQIDLLTGLPAAYWRGRKAALEELRATAASFGNLDALWTPSETEAVLVDMADHLDCQYRGPACSLKVSLVSLQIACMAELSADACRDVQRVARLFPIGCLFLPTELIGKMGRLTPSEFDVIKTIPTRASLILARIPGLADVAQAVERVRERQDGSGYPYQLRRGDIPSSAQIVGLAELYVVMRHSRTGSGWPLSKVLEEIARKAGTAFDSKLCELVSRLDASRLDRAIAHIQADPEAQMKHAG